MNGKGLKLFILLIVLVNVIYAQNDKRSNIWYFGALAGVDFNSEPPVSLTNSKLTTREGCATYCDKNGKLLIYTDGSQIWNRNHEIIPNAIDLGGSSSATQSGIIVPKPGSNNLLYVFSVGAGETKHGLLYSIIDLNLNGGLGGIVVKRQRMLFDCSEKITAILHCNRSDFWIVAHDMESPKFFVWKLTDIGLSAKPVTQRVGSTTRSYPGYLKASLDGSKLVSASTVDDILDVFHFDIQTGIISTYFTISDATTKNVYGVEFSPNGKLLYYLAYHDSGDRSIVQINLDLPTTRKIINSRTTILRSFLPGSGYFAIQNAPNGKMYLSQSAYKFLSEISNPNKIGKACNYKRDGIDLKGRQCLLGLPNMIANYLQAQDSFISNIIIDTCGHIANLSIVINPSDTGTTYDWYKDGKLISRIVQRIEVYEPGNYKVIIKSPLECNDSVTYKEFIHEFDVVIPDSLTMSQATILDPTCGKENGDIEVSVTGGSPPYEYSIDNGTTFQSNNIFGNLKEGIYTIIIRDNMDCEIRRTFSLVDKNDLKIQNIIVTNATCGLKNGMIEVIMQDVSVNYMYSLDGITFQNKNSFIDLKPQSYNIRIKDDAGCEIMMEVNIEAGTNPIILIDSIIFETCGMSNAEIHLYGNEGTPPYTFSDDGINYLVSNIFKNLSAGINYTFYIRDSLGCTHQIPISIVEIEGPKISSINITPVLCNMKNGIIEIEANGSSMLSYSIDGINFQDHHIFDNLAPGEYTVTIKDENDCVVEKTVVVVDDSSTIKYSSNINNITCDQLNGIIDVVATKEALILEYSINGFDYFESGLFTGLGEGEYTIYVRDKNSCIEEISFTLIKEEAPTIDAILIIPSTCNMPNGAITIIVKGGKNVKYSLNGSDFMDDNKFINLLEGKYFITVKDENNCIINEEVTIEGEGKSLFQSIDIMSTHCGVNNGALKVIADGIGLTYSINGSTFKDDNYFDNLAPGIYEIQIIDENGCLETRKAQILESEGISIDSIALTSAHCNESNGIVRIVASGGTGVYTMKVDNSDIYDQLEISNLAKGEYEIEISDEIGCRADTILNISQVDCTVYIPNSFSPNGDGINDVFSIFTHDGFDGIVNSMSVYDRWGNQVFKSSKSNQNSADGWDGKLKGRALNPGVFIYLIEVVNERGELQIYNGDLSLVK